MEKYHIYSNDVDVIYNQLETLCNNNKHCYEPVVVCLQNYDGNSLPKDCQRHEEIREKLFDLLDQNGGKYFRFNHGSKYFSTDFFPERNDIKYISQLERATELIRDQHDDKAIMQVIMPDMLQGKVVPIPAVLSVILKPRIFGQYSYLDIVATYRTQEFSTWWPLNILELSHIQKKAIEKLFRFSPGHIYTISIQGSWNVDIPLSSKSALDDKDRAEEVANNILTLFNFTALNEDRHESCVTIIEALTEKKSVTSAFSYDTIGMKILLDRLNSAGHIMANDKTSDTDELKLYLKVHEKIKEKIPIIIVRLNEFSERYNKHHNNTEPLINEIHKQFNLLISLFQSLKERLQGI